MAQLTNKEFAELPSGTKATKVKVFDGDTGNQVDAVYILKENNNDYDEELQDAQEVADGYFTEIWAVTRK